MEGICSSLTEATPMGRATALYHEWTASTPSPSSSSPTNSRQVEKMPYPTTVPSSRPSRTSTSQAIPALDVEDLRSVLQSNHFTLSRYDKQPISTLGGGRITHLAFRLPEGILTATKQILQYRSLPLWHSLMLPEHTPVTP